MRTAIAITAIIAISGLISLACIKPGNTTYEAPDTDATLEASNAYATLIAAEATYETYKAARVAVRAAYETAEAAASRATLIASDAWATYTAPDRTAALTTLEASDPWANSSNGNNSIMVNRSRENLERL